jgi:hypothetical protein
MTQDQKDQDAIKQIARALNMDSGVVLRIRGEGRASAQRNPIGPTGVYGKVDIAEILAAVPEAKLEDVHRALFTLSLVFSGSGEQEYVWAGFPVYKASREPALPSILVQAPPFDWSTFVSVDQMEREIAAGTYGPPDDLIAGIAFLRRRQ